MMDSEQVLEKREQKLLKWFKNRYNLALFALIAFSVALRIYYFLLTQNQPLWWDEAEYMVLAQKWIHGNSYVLDPVRQVLFPLILSMFLRISNSEFLPRLLIFLLSTSTVIGIYLIGKEMYDKKIGLLASFLMSVFYMNLFFSQRLLVDIPSLAFYIFSALFFYKYSKNNTKKDLYIGAVIIGIGTLFKLTTAYFLFAMIIYFLFTEKMNIFKKKEAWIAALIYCVVLSPYIIWGYYEFHGFVLTQAASVTAPTNYITSTLSMINTYAVNFPFYIFSLDPSQNFSTPWFLAVIVILGVLIYYFYRLFLGFDILMKKDEKELKREFFVLLIFLAPIILVSIMISHYEDRYIINAFPAMFIILSVIIFNIFDYIKNKKSKKSWAFIFLVIIILFFGYMGLKTADSSIKSKLTSYKEIRDAAYWIKDNSLPTDTIISESANQMMYYSERDYYRFNVNQTEMEKLIQDKKPKYYMVSGIERTFDYTYSYPQENNLTVAQAYFSDSQKTQPIIIIYEFPDNNPKLKFSELIPANNTKNKSLANSP